MPCLTESECEKTGWGVGTVGDRWGLDDSKFPNEANDHLLQICIGERHTSAKTRLAQPHARPHLHFTNK